MPAIKLDLRRDLPKVRERVNQRNMGKCRYGSPCAVGAMLDTYADRRRLDRAKNEEGTDELNILALIDAGHVTVPQGQALDFAQLQNQFDAANESGFWATLAKLEIKYAQPAPDR